MAKYLISGTYTQEGLKSLLREGGTKRKSLFEENISRLGGTVEAFYFAFGTNDLYSILELPDNVGSAAISLAINVGGGFKGETIVLLTAAEMDQAVIRARSGGTQDQAPKENEGPPKPPKPKMIPGR